MKRIKAGLQYLPGVLWEMLSSEIAPSVYYESQYVQKFTKYPLDGMW